MNLNRMNHMRPAARTIAGRLLMLVTAMAMALALGLTAAQPAQASAPVVGGMAYSYGNGKYYWTSLASSDSSRGILPGKYRVTVSGNSSASVVVSSDKSRDKTYMHEDGPATSTAFFSRGETDAKVVDVAAGSHVEVSGLAEGATTVWVHVAPYQNTTQYQAGAAQTLGKGAHWLDPGKYRVDAPANVASAEVAVLKGYADSPADVEDPDDLISDYYADTKAGWNYAAGFWTNIIDIPAGAHLYLEKAGFTVRKLTPTFTDVNSGTAHYEDILWLAAQGITTGYDDGSFGGMRDVNRQDMAAFLYRLAGSPEFDPASVRNPFRDVNSSTPHYKEILWLYSKGIAKGYGDGTFGGMRTVVRQDMAAFLYRYSVTFNGRNPSGSATNFRDVNSGTSHYEEIIWLSRTSITTGYGDGTFGGMRTVVRQDMAAFLHRMDTNVL